MGGLGLKNDPKQLDIIFIYECSPSRRAMLWVRALGSSINNVTTILKKRGEGGLKMEEKLMMNVVLKTVTTMWDLGIKNHLKLTTSFMDGPYLVV